MFPWKKLPVVTPSGTRPTHTKTVTGLSIQSAAAKMLEIDRSVVRFLQDGRVRLQVDSEGRLEPTTAVL